MKILIAGLTKKLQFLRLKEEASKKGHVVDGCLASDLIISADIKHFEPMLSNGKSLKEYDLIYMLVGKRIWEWSTAALYLSKNNKTIVINKKIIDSKYNFYFTPVIDYLRQTENGISYPKSALLFSVSSVEKVISKFKFPVILKSSLGHRGEGVYLVDNIGLLKSKVRELTAGIKSCVIREFIPNDGDVRVFCVGYQAIGAMKRTPKKGDFRSNISQGGSGSPFDLEGSPEVKELAEKVSRVMQTEIAGVDIIFDKFTKKPYVLEVNPGPQIEGIEKYTGINVAQKIIEYFEQSCR